MSVSQQIRDTLIRSGDRMSLDEITDAIGGLADKKFVQAICIQHHKKGAFGRAMEDGRMVYWILDPKASPANDDRQVEEQGADTIPAIHVAAHAAAAIPSKVDEPIAYTPKVAQQERIARPKTAAAKVPPMVAEHVHVQAPVAPSTTAQLNAMVSDLQADRIQRMERTSHTLGRILSNLLSDAIDAQLEHDVLRQLSNAQLAVQEVHGYLINVG